MKDDRIATPIRTPDPRPPRAYDDARAAIDDLCDLFEVATTFLRDRFRESIAGGMPEARFRAFYPELRITTTSYGRTDSRLSFGHVPEPGHYAATITRPDLFRNYLTQQVDLLMRSHEVPVSVGWSTTPIPIHFAVLNDAELAVPQDGVLPFLMRDVFDVPDLTQTNDDIVNGVGFTFEDGSRPLAPFTAQRIDYSLARLAHYTATAPDHFQNHVLFTNYQFYVDEFVAYARDALRDPGSGYQALVGPMNQMVTRGDPDAPIVEPSKMPQMPTYHITREGNQGITLVNIGVGPSNAKTATDHIAVLRPHVWLMVGHCAGLRNSQSLGDYVLAHAYLREDHVLDDDLPVWVPIPALAEVQVSLEQAVAEVTALEGYELKRIMRTGTVATIDNRNWELREHTRPRPAPVAEPRHRARHGIGDHSGQRLPLPRPLRHAALRIRQAAARRAQAAGHGERVLPHAGRPSPPDRRARDGASARDASGAPAQPKAAVI